MFKKTIQQSKYKQILSSNFVISMINFNISII